jgi:anti-sigma regulatory factor (Ser/Thr protein kinase)
MSFSLEPCFSSVDRVRRGVQSALNDWFGGGENRRETADFCQVIGELVNNAVEHGGCTVIEATLRLEPDRARFTLVTDGKCFDTAASPAVMPEFDPDGELPEGGFGLAIIRRLSDGLRYAYRDGKNITEVVKEFEGV